jgi:mRNA interferase RelE/StbE
MMAHTVSLVRSARKELQRLPAPYHDRIVKQLQQLGHDPRPFGAEKLQGRSEYKLRVGNLRIVYGIDDARREITVFVIEDRKDVYRRLKRT